MNILLLGHHDVASLYALDRLIALLPDHSHRVLLSSGLQAGQSPDPDLAALDTADADLCQRFLRGELIGPVAEELSDPDDAAFNRPNSPQGLRLLSALQPDVVVSVRYRQILHDAAIAVPRHGVLNLHSGILPEYRGVMATFWAMLNGETQIGTTLHRIVDSGIDTGPIIGISRRATRPELSYLANVLGLYADGCDMTAQAVRAIDHGRPLRASNQTEKGHYYAAPGAADVSRFIRQRLRLCGAGDAAEMRALQNT